MSKSQSSSMLSWFLAAIAALVFLACVGCDTQPHPGSQLTDQAAQFEFDNWYKNTNVNTSTSLSMEVSKDFLINFTNQYNCHTDTFISEPEQHGYISTVCTWQKPGGEDIVILNHRIDTFFFIRMLNNEVGEEITVDELSDFQMCIKLSEFVPCERYYDGLKRVIQFKSRYGALQRIVFEDYAG